MNQRVLALDLGFRHTGWALLVDGELCEVGTIHTDKQKRGSEESALAYNARVCRHLTIELDSLRRITQPQTVLIESPIGAGRGSRAVSCMAMAVGACAALFRNSDTVWVAPKRTKGKAVEPVCSRWPDFEFPATERDREHVFDAASAYLLWAEHEHSEK